MRRFRLSQTAIEMKIYTKYQGSATVGDVLDETRNGELKIRFDGNKSTYQMPKTWIDIVDEAG